MAKKTNLLEGATIKRGVQYTTDGKKSEENIVYSVEIELNNRPVVVTMRIGKEFTEAMITDKRTGEMLEYAGQKGKNVEIVKKHNLSPADIVKMFEPQGKK